MHRVLSINIYINIISKDRSTMHQTWLQPDNISVQTSLIMMLPWLMEDTRGSKKDKGKHIN